VLTPELMDLRQAGSISALLIAGNKFVTQNHEAWNSGQRLSAMGWIPLE
jgi:hypothetical protein